MKFANMTVLFYFTLGAAEGRGGRGSGAWSAGKDGVGEVKGEPKQSEAKLSGSVEGEVAEPLLFYCYYSNVVFVKS